MCPGGWGLPSPSCQEIAGVGPCLVAKRKMTALGEVLLSPRRGIKESEFSCGPRGCLRQLKGTAWQSRGTSETNECGRCPHCLQGKGSLKPVKGMI